MFRAALQPRWLGLLAVVVVVMVTFGLLGAWQLNVARNKGQAAAVAAVPHLPVAAVTSVMQPGAGFPSNGTGRRVTATGRYDPSGQVLVTPRVLRGTAGYWVVTPLVLDTDHARLAVVRGFVPRSAAAGGTPTIAVPPPPPPTGTVTVSGTLEPSESPSSDADVTSLPAGQLASVDLAALVNRWQGTVYNAFVLASAESGEPSPSAGVARVPPPAPEGGGLAWRNAAYALQWWIFAGFALYMWVKMVREDAATVTPGDPEHPDPESRTREAVSV